MLNLISEKNKMLKKIINKIKRIIKEDIIKKEIIVTNIPIHKNLLLENKVAIIFGGTGSIGENIVEEFLNSGAEVIVSGRDSEKLENMRKKYRVKTIQIDLTEYDTFETKVREAASYYNGLDICVISAGVQTEKDKKLQFFDIKEDDYDKVFDVNLKGVFFICQKVSKYMIENKIKGHIVNICSEMGFRSAKVPYDISRWGQRGFIQGLGVMLAEHQIVVNAVAPGMVSTEMAGYKEGNSLYLKSHPNFRYALPQEIAKTCVFLASDLSNNIIGETIISDGGSHLN